MFRTALLAALFLAPATARAADPIALFNGKDLTGWTTFTRYDKDEKIEPSADPKGVFKVEDGAIHISGEKFACLTTAGEYENYRLVVEFKWGTKKWPPRENAKRDSGILMHATGPDKIWTKSIECQIQEGDCGDFHMVSGTSITVGGKKVPGYAKKTADAEKPNGEWNTIEVICDGGKITNIVNGKVVNEGTDASVTKGKIILQSEGAEVFYRKVELTPLSAAKP